MRRGHRAFQQHALDLLPIYYLQYDKLTESYTQPLIVLDVDVLLIRKIAYSVPHSCLTYTTNIASRCLVVKRKDARKEIFFTFFCRQ